MDWLAQNWIWLALGIVVIFVMSRGGLGHRVGGHAGHDHGKAGVRGTGDNGLRQLEPASAAGQPGTVAVADTASSGTGARATPAQDVPRAHRRHRCC